MPKANAIDLAKTLRKLKTGNFEFFHILTLAEIVNQSKRNDPIL